MPAAGSAPSSPLSRRRSLDGRVRRSRRLRWFIAPAVSWRFIFESSSSTDDPASSSLKRDSMSAVPAPNCN